MVSLIDDTRQFFKSCIGLPEPLNTTRQAELTHSICQYVVGDDAPLDHRGRARGSARGHAAWSSPTSASSPTRGCRCTRDDGHPIGTLCAIDVRPRAWTPPEIATLRRLADVAEQVIRAAPVRARDRGRARAPLPAREPAARDRGRGQPAPAARPPPPRGRRPAGRARHLGLPRRQRADADRRRLRRRLAAPRRRRLVRGRRRLRAQPRGRRAGRRPARVVERDAARPAAARADRRATQLDHLPRAPRHVAVRHRRDRADRSERPLRRPLRRSPAAAEDERERRRGGRAAARPAVRDRADRALDVGEHERRGLRDARVHRRPDRRPPGHPTPRSATASTS